jgi:hypothetical protein
MIMINPFQIFNTSTTSGLKDFVLAYYKNADDVRVFLKEPGKVDILILMRSKWWWRFTFGYMRRRHTAEARDLLDLNAPLGVKLIPKIFYERTDFLKMVVDNE